MAAEDFDNLSPDPSELDTSSSYSGNRPASGARRATPGEVLSQGFQGAANAGDFLGLDTEFTGSQGGSPLDLVAPPTTMPEDADGADGYAPAPQPAGDPVQEFAEAPSAFEFGEDLGTEEGSEADFDASAPTGRKPLLVSALLAVALGVGGVLYGPGLYQRVAGDSAPAARIPGAGKTTVASPSKAPAPGTTTPTKTDVPGGPAVATSEPAAAGPDQPAATKGRTTPGATRPPTRTGEPDAPTVAAKPAQSTPRGSTPPGDVLADLLSVAGTSPSTSDFPDLTGDAYDWASSDKLELIWRGKEVPLEAVKADAKTLMPRVGEVRVFTTSGDVFEGRLYAVGQNRVWIDTAPGRVGLDGAMVAQIDVLPPAPAGQQGQTKDNQLLAGGKRVRVRVPGGMLYGRVLKYEGEDVLLVLEDGSGKVRVKANELEDLGSRRAVVVSR